MGDSRVVYELQLASFWYSDAGRAEAAHIEVDDDRAITSGGRSARR